MRHPFPLEHLALTRRELLARCGTGLGALALGGMLAETGAQAAGGNPLLPRTPHFPAKAKHVIHLFMNGGPSHVDTFDPKPMLTKYAGKELPGRHAADRTADRRRARLAIQIPPLRPKRHRGQRPVFRTWPSRSTTSR